MNARFKAFSEEIDLPTVNDPYKCVILSCRMGDIFRGKSVTDPDGYPIFVVDGPAYITTLGKYFVTRDAPRPVSEGIKEAPTPYFSDDFTCCYERGAGWDNAP